VVRVTHGNSEQAVFRWKAIIFQGKIDSALFFLARNNREEGYQMHKIEY
jgi:hypothetical protein